MYLKLYSILVTIILIISLIRANNDVKIIRHNNTREITKTKKEIGTIKQCDISSVESLPIIKGEIDFQINSELTRIKNYIKITPEQESKIVNFLREKELLRYSNIDLNSYYESLEKYQNLEQILGNQKLNELKKAEEKARTKESIENYRKQAYYYAKILNLDEQKQELLLTLLSSSDQYREAEITYISKELQLNEIQQNNLSSIFGRYWDDWKFIEHNAIEQGINVEDKNFDIKKYRNFLFKEQAKQFLDLKQQDILNKYLN